MVLYISHMTEFTRKCLVSLVINTKIAINALFDVRVQNGSSKRELVGNDKTLVTAPQLLEAGLPYSCFTELCA